MYIMILVPCGDDRINVRVTALIGRYCYFQRRIQFYVVSTVVSSYRALNILVKATRSRIGSALVQRHVINTLYSKVL